MHFALPYRRLGLQVLFLEKALFFAIHGRLNAAVAHWKRSAEVQVAVGHRVVVFLGAIGYICLLKQLYLLLQQRQGQIGGHMLILRHNSFLNLNIV